MKESKFHMYAIGIAAENLKPGESELEVCPIEQLGFLDGEITSNQEEFLDEGVDAEGNAYSVKVESSNSLKAKWFPFETNRKTAPNIRRGMRVVIWKYADGDIYFWTDTGLDSKLMRRETVVYVWSNTDKDVDDLTPENSWFMKVSTHEKIMTFATNRSDGETHSVVVQINIKDGSAFIMDDRKNHFELDSLNNMLEMQNGDGTKVRLDKRDLLLEAPDNIKVNTKNFTVMGENAKILSANFFVNGAKMAVKAAAEFLSGLKQNGKSVGTDHQHISAVPGNPTSGIR